MHNLEKRIRRKKHERTRVADLLKHTELEIKLEQLKAMKGSWWTRLWRTKPLEAIALGWTLVLGTVGFAGIAPRTIDPAAPVATVSSPQTPGKNLSPSLQPEPKPDILDDLSFVNEL